MYAKILPEQNCGSDIERREDFSLARLVDIGIDLYNMGKWSAAREFFETPQVPATIAARVLFHRQQWRAGRVKAGESFLNNGSAKLSSVAIRS